MLDEGLVNGTELCVETVEEAASPSSLELVADGPLDEFLDVALARLGLDGLDELRCQMPGRLTRGHGFKGTRGACLIGRTATSAPTSCQTAMHLQPVLTSAQIVAHTPATSAA